MTINELIEKLANEKKNGAVAVLRNNYNDFEKLRKECDIEKDVMRRIILRKDIHQKYDEISGFIWGLFAADYIGHNELNEILDEFLIELSETEKCKRDSLDNVISSAEKRSDEQNEINIEKIDREERQSETR